MTTTSNLSITVLYAVAYILYLALEEGSPIFKQVLPVLLYLHRFRLEYFLIPTVKLLGSSTFILTNHRISFDFFS